MGMFVTLLAGPGNVLVPNSSVWGVNMGVWVRVDSYCYTSYRPCLKTAPHSLHTVQPPPFLPTYVSTYISLSLPSSSLTLQSTLATASLKHEHSPRVFVAWGTKSASLFIGTLSSNVAAYSSKKKLSSSRPSHLVPSYYSLSSIASLRFNVPTHMSISAYWWSTTHLAPISTLSLIMEILLTWVVHVPGLGGIWKL